MSPRTPPAPRQRPLRVGEELRHALAAIFERGDLRDPVLSDLSLTVAEVRMSPDLRHAEIYVVPLGGGRSDEALAALGRAKGFLKSRIAERVRLKYVPELRFRLDDRFERASEMGALIARTRSEDADRHDTGTDRTSRSENGDDGNA